MFDFTRGLPAREQYNTAVIRTTILVICFTTIVAGQQKSPEQPRCNPREFSGRCYWTRGRLRAYDGTPAIRLWIVGTHRLLGISSGPGAEKYDPLDNEHPQIPGEIMKKFTLQSQVYGDFEVCPLEQRRRGTMQQACIAGARNLSVVESKKKR